MLSFWYEINSRIVLMLLLASGFSIGKVVRFPYSLSGPVNTVDTKQQALLGDKIFCQSDHVIVNMFCQQDLPAARREITETMIRIEERCEYVLRAETSYAFNEGYYLKKSSEHLQNSSHPLFAMQSPHKSYSDSYYSSSMSRLTKTRKRPEFPIDFGAVPISRTDFYDHPVEAQLQQCSVVENQDRWTFELVGWYTGTGGYSWHSAFYWDAGKFGQLLVEGPVWVTTFGFMPVDQENNVLGVPPIHIHHMHVTSCQSFVKGSNLNSEGSCAVEFDVHGDRQCQSHLGGTDCLVRSFPKGFGMKLSDPMNVFFDLNDVRKAGSPSMLFAAKWIYKWTHSNQRDVGKFMATTLPYLIDIHDDFILKFDPSTRTEYVAWSERRFPFSGSIVHMYWHTHHKRCTDQWVMSATAKQAGLENPLFSNVAISAYGHLGNISAGAMSIIQLMDDIIGNLNRAQRKCLSAFCSVLPQIRCSLNLDRWERMENTYESFIQERFHAPHCKHWNFTAGDYLTLVHFFEPQERLKNAEYFWVHAGPLYAFYVTESWAPHSLLLS